MTDKPTSLGLGPENDLLCARQVARKIIRNQPDNAAFQAAAKILLSDEVASQADIHKDRTIMSLVNEVVEKLDQNNPATTQAINGLKDVGPAIDIVCGTPPSLKKPAAATERN